MRDEHDEHEVDLFEATAHAIGQGMSQIRHTDSSLARLGEAFHKMETGDWEDDDFVEITREELPKEDDIRFVLLYVEPLAPRFFKYRGVKILGGNAWWTLEDGEREKTITKVLDIIDERLDAE